MTVPYIKTLAQILATAIGARQNCIKSGNTEWECHEETALFMTRNWMPSGSGVDSGTRIDLERSTGYKLIFHAGYHHMDDSGMYDGWTEHTITVWPSFDGISVKISGRDRNGVKEYLYQLFDVALAQSFRWNVEAQEWRRIPAAWEHVHYTYDSIWC